MIKNTRSHCPRQFSPADVHCVPSYSSFLRHGWNSRSPTRTNRCRWCDTLRTVCGESRVQSPAENRSVHRVLPCNPRTRSRRQRKARVAYHARPLRACPRSWGARHVRQQRGETHRAFSRPDARRRLISNPGLSSCTMETSSTGSRPITRTLKRENQSSTVSCSKIFTDGPWRTTRRTSMPTGLFSTCGNTSTAARHVPDSCLSRHACARTSLPTHPPHLLRRREALSLLSTTAI